MVCKYNDSLCSAGGKIFFTPHMSFSLGAIRHHDRSVILRCRQMQVLHSNWFFECQKQCTYSLCLKILWALFKTSRNNLFDSSTYILRCSRLKKDIYRRLSISDEIVAEMKQQILNERKWQRLSESFAVRSSEHKLWQQFKPKAIYGYYSKGRVEQFVLGCRKLWHVYNQFSQDDTVQQTQRCLAQDLICQTV